MGHLEKLKTFKEVRSRYDGLLVSVLWKLTGNREIFAEAMQYALLGMWRHIEKLGSEKSGSYIYRIALSANSKAWKNRIGKDSQLAYDEIAEQSSCRKQTCDDELAVKTRKAIAQLSPKQTKAIVIRYFQQKDYQVIADDLNCSQATARSHVSKALRNLKRNLKK